MMAHRPFSGKTDTNNQLRTPPVSPSRSDSVVPPPISVAEIDLNLHALLRQRDRLQQEELDAEKAKTEQAEMQLLDAHHERDDIRAKYQQMEKDYRPLEQSEARSTCALDELRGVIDNYFQARYQDDGVVEDGYGGELSLVDDIS